MPNSFDTAQPTILAIEDEGDVLAGLASILAAPAIDAIARPARPLPGSWLARCIRT